MTDPILHVHVAEPVTDSLAKVAEIMEALERREPVTPYCSIGFADMNELLAVLTPRSWQIIRVLRQQGALSSSELARRLGIEAQQIAQDIRILLDWHLLHQDEDGRISAPYSKLVVDVKFPSAKAA